MTVCLDRGDKMDFDKMKQWMEMAQNMSGGDFWKNVFDDEQLKSFQNYSHFPFQQGDGQMRRNEDAFPLIDIVETHDELQFCCICPATGNKMFSCCPTENISS